jgi:hypothetical protein
MAARKWTAEQRKQQSKKIREWMPWLKSTGAKTEVGKSKSSRNAFKGAVNKQTRLIRQEINSLLHKQAFFIQ